MFKKIIIIINKIKNLLRLLPKVAATYAFLTYLALFFPILAFGGFLFYQYNLTAQQAELETIKSRIQLRENSYQNILAEWERRKKIFEEIKIIDYQNPFHGTTSESIQLTEPEI